MRFGRIRQGQAYAISHLIATLQSLIVILGGLLLIIPGLTQAAPPAQAPNTPPSVSGGRVNWAENCLPCHGPAGQGDGPTAQAIEGPLPNFADPASARRLIPAENFDVIKNGRIENFMPPWGNRFDDAQIWDLTAYVWRLSTTPEDLAAGENLYLSQCAACHGEGGAGDGPDAVTELPDFTHLENMVQLSQADLFANFKASEQHAQFETLTETELWQTLDHVRTFSFAVPQQNGVLSGQAVNGTTSEPAKNIEVTLRVFDANAEVETLTSRTDAAGNYTFENLSNDPSLLYLLEAQYQGVTYQSNEFGGFTPGDVTTTLDLNVYETTTQADAIEVTQLHYIIAFGPETVNVLQIFVVGNAGNQAYIGAGSGQTFSFSLPEEASQVIFQGDPDGSRFVQIDNGYADTAPITPGSEGLSIVASYVIPYDSDILTVEMPLPADVASINLLMEHVGVDLSSEQVEFVETRSVQGDTFSIFNGTNLRKGQTLRFNLSNLSLLSETAAPGATIVTDPVDQDLLRWLIMGLGGLAIVTAGVIYPLLRSRWRPQAATSQADLAIRRQRLLLTLARLDETFEAGELDETIYRQARAKYKAELADIMEVQ